MKNCFFFFFWLWVNEACWTCFRKGDSDLDESLHEHTEASNISNMKAFSCTFRRFFLKCFNFAEQKCNVRGMFSSNVGNKQSPQHYMATLEEVSQLTGLFGPKCAICFAGSLLRYLPFISSLRACNSSASSSGGEYFLQTT